MNKEWNLKIIYFLSLFNKFQTRFPFFFFEKFGRTYFSISDVRYASYNQRTHF